MAEDARRFHTSNIPRRLNKKWVFLSSVLGVLLLLLAIELHLREVDGFWSELLLHLGAGIALSGILFFLDRKYEEVGDEVKSLVQKAEAGLRAIDLKLDEQLAKQEANDHDSALQFCQNGNYAALRALLASAGRLGAISNLGVRANIANTKLYLRVRLVEGEYSPNTPVESSTQQEGHIHCTIERSDRTEVASFSWNPTDSSDSVFLTLHDRISQAGQSLSDDQFLADSTGLREAIASTLRAAIESRTGADKTLRPIGKVFQHISDGWFVTSAGLEHIRDNRQITVEQLRNGKPVPISSDGNEGDLSAVLEVARAAWKPSEWTPPIR